MEIFCPNCKTKALPENINIQTDLGKCGKCGSIFKVSDVNFSQEIISSQPPMGSKIEMYEGVRDSYEFYYPPSGFQPIMLPVIIFMIFWLGFVAFWTIAALTMAGGWFAAFSLPFWLVGGGFVISIFNSMYQSETISLDRYKILIEKKRPFLSTHSEVYLDEIVSIELKNTKMTPSTMMRNSKSVTNTNGNHPKLNSPALITGAKTEFFFTGASDAEREWITLFLQENVKRFKSGH